MEVSFLTACTIGFSRLKGLLDTVCDLKPLPFQVRGEPVYYSYQIIGAVDLVQVPD